MRLAGQGDSDVIAAFGIVAMQHRAKNTGIGRPMGRHNAVDGVAVGLQGGGRFHVECRCCLLQADAAFLARVEISYNRKP